jgi:replicative DNA helicase
MTNYELEDAVIMLHNIARTVERKVGFRPMVQDIRKSADSLSNMLQPLPASETK